MKALATVALIGLASGFEDHEFAHYGGNSHSGSQHQHVGHGMSGNYTLPTTYSVPFNHTQLHHHQNTTHQPIRPLHPNWTKKPGTGAVPHKPGYHLDSQGHWKPNRPGYHLDSQGHWKPNRPGYHLDSQGRWRPNRHGASHHPKNTTQVPHHKNHTQHLPHAQLKKQILADDDDEFFFDDEELFIDEDDELFAAEDNELGCFKRNHTQTQKPVQPRLRPNVIPNRHNATHTHNGSHNKTRPFHPLPRGSHNRTAHKNIVAHDDEEFFTVEDDVLFDLAKLLADASKTVGDVKQNPKNYGELLNDAINIAKDIKRKDDFEDSFLSKIMNQRKQQV